MTVASPNPLLAVSAVPAQNNNDDKMQRDIASHVLALMIEAEKYENCEKQAREFLMYLMEKRDIHGMPLSHEAYTFALMTILKNNELAKIFCSNRISFSSSVVICFPLKKK